MHAGAGPHRPTLQGARSAAAAQGGHRETSAAAARRAVRAELRSAVLRRDQHVLRRRHARLPAGQARLFARQPPDRPQVCIGLVVTEDGFPLGLRSLRRQHARFEDGADDRRVDGEEVRLAESRLGDGSRHGQRREPEVPARARRHSTSSARRRRCCGSSSSILTEQDWTDSPGRRGSETRAQPRRRGDVRPGAQRRSPRERTGDA